MNCAKCSQPSRIGRPPGSLALAQNVRLLKVGEMDGHDQMKCPKCRAVFWFPQDMTAAQKSFNQQLMPA